MGYREELWLSRWVSVLFIGLIGLLSAAMVLESCLDAPIGNEPAPTGVLLGLEVFFILLFINFRTMRIRIDADRIEVRWGAIRNVISLCDLETCQTIQARFRTYGGQGIRLGTDGSSAFITSFGKAVKVVRKTKTPFVFTTSKPAEVTSLINALACKRSQ